jgi:hypothetical protein
MVIMRQHAVIGYNILKSSEAAMLQLAAEIAYRTTNAGTAAAIRTAWPAKRSRWWAASSRWPTCSTRSPIVRPYKQAWSLEEARAFLVENSGTHFDPQCVDALLRRWPAVLEIRARFRDAAPLDAA